LKFSSLEMMAARNLREMPAEYGLRDSAKINLGSQNLAQNFETRIPIYDA
jgi:hypothetical protein